MASSKTQYNTTWVTPPDWTVGQGLTASDFNAYIRDQQNALKKPGHAYGVVDEGANYTIASTSWTDVDTTNLSMTFNTSGGVVHVWFVVNFYFVSGTGATKVYFDIDMDGTRQGGDDGITGSDVETTTDMRSITIMADINSSTAASHTFKLQWKRITGTSMTVGMYAGAGTSNKDIHPRMGAWERS